MIHLLVNSLMADHGLENALMSAITFETREQDTISEILSDDAVPLLHLVHQLIGNSISMSLSYFKQVHCVHGIYTLKYFMVCIKDKYMYMYI